MEIIPFNSGGYRLRGVLHVPETPLHGIVIGCHGLTGTADSAKQTALAEACGRQGVAFFRFDHRGCGESEGSFEDGMWLASRCADLKAAYAMMRDKGLPVKNLGLFGSSMGGAVCLATAGELNPNAVVTAAAPVSSDAVAPRSIQQELPPGMDFHPEMVSFDLRDRLQGVRNLLVLHGDADEVVPVASAHAIMRHAGAPKRLVLLGRGDHRLTHPRHRKRFMRETLGWFRKMMA